MLPGTAETERHVQIALGIDERLSLRDFWVSFSVDYEGANPTDLAEAIEHLVSALDEWLSQVAPGEMVSEQRFEINGWSFVARAAPKGVLARERGGTVVANPYPAIAYWPGT